MKNKCASLFFFSFLIFAACSLFAVENSEQPAKYEVITEVTASGTSGKTHLMVLKTSEQDLQACQLITDNINIMEKYNVDWKCDFPISDTIPLIRKPNWQTVAPEVMTSSRSHFDKKWGRPTLPLQEGVNGFFFPYDLSPVHEGEGIFMLTVNRCNNLAGSYQSTWYGKEDGSLFLFMPHRSRLNRIILVNNSLYLVTYYEGPLSPKTFGVAKINKQRPGTDLICNIQSNNPTTDSQE